MSSKKYVLDGSMVECNQGYVPAKLVVNTNQKVKIQGKFVATDTDVQIPATFGNCRLKPTNSGHLPCIPALQKWTKTSEQASIGGSQKFLFEESQCMCGTGGKVTVMQNVQINIGGTGAAQFKQIALAIPGAMLGNDKTPKVVETYWMDENYVDKITSSYIGQKASLHVLTENMDIGEYVTVKVADSREGEKDRTYGGKVQANGTAKLNLVPLKKDHITRRSNESACIIADAIAPVVAAPESSQRVLVEKGVVRRGRTITENGKIIIVNRKNERGYDWIYGDDPSNALMEKNGMSWIDRRTVKARATVNTSGMLLSNMKAVLWMFSDVNQDGSFGQNGVKLVDHFHTGQGKPFVFDNNSNPVKEIKNSSKFKDTFIPDLKKELKARYDANNYINKNEGDVYDFSTKTPRYGPSGGLFPSVNEVSTFIGGIQGCIANYEVYKENGQISVEILNLTFLDTFGAGWEDGGANDWMKQMIPGLLDMFCLQHFKNVNDKSKFQPFAIALNIEL